MKLSAIMSPAGLAMYAEVALLCFFGAFLAILIHTLRSSNRAEFDRASRLPLEDDATPTRETTHEHA